MGVIVGKMGWVVVIALALWGCQYVSGGESEEAVGRVTFLDVGQGLAVLLEYQGRYGMYDVGPDSAGLMDTLRNRGIDSLDWVVVSHNHRDHFGGLLEILPAVSIARLMVGPDTSGGFLMDSVLRSARRHGVPVDTISRGDRVVLGPVRGASMETAPGLELGCIWPPSYIPVGENGASTVMQVHLAGDAGGAFEGVGAGRILLTGDLDSLGEARLLEMGADLSAEVLQVGHHGSSHSSTLKFLNRVSPGVAVISVGAGNGYGHPREDVLRKLLYVIEGVAEGRIFRTDLHGSVTFTLVPHVGVVKGW